MTTSSSFLNLTLYNTGTDGAVPYYTFINDLAGTSASSNMQKIDKFAQNYSASLVTLQNKDAVITGSGVMSGTSASTVIHNDSTIYSDINYPGSYNEILVDKYGHITAGSYVPVDTTGSQIRVGSRQGGDANNWNVQGSASYVSGSSVEMQLGVGHIAWPGGFLGTSIVIAFSKSYVHNPIVFSTVLATTTSKPITTECTLISGSGFTLLAKYDDVVGSAPPFGNTTDVSWQAIGNV